MGPGNCPAGLQLGDPFDRKRRLSERLDDEPKQKEGVVVAGRSIQPKRVTSPASVDEHPFAIAADADGDRLHQRVAVGVAIARAVVVDVPAPQTVRAVVPVGRAGGLRGDVQPATAASEGLWTTAPRAMALIS